MRSHTRSSSDISTSLNFGSLLWEWREHWSPQIGTLRSSGIDSSRRFNVTLGLSIY